MSLDPKIVRRTLDTFDRRRSEKNDQMDTLRREVYERSPRIAEIERELRVSAIRMSMLAMKRGSEPDITALKKDILALQAERAERLVELGLPYDYLTRKSVCGRCDDNGFIGATPCDCFLKAYAAEQAAELSKSLNIGSQSFERFDFSLYPDEIDPEAGISPRKNIEEVYDACRNFAENFDNQRGGILLYGDTGVGKTYLSACIARVVAGSGHSVVYETAYNLFTRYEERKFGREDEDTADDINRYENCDLLILDDLGTELVNSLTVTNLYHLVNLRLSAEKCTVISTNLSPESIGSIYSRQIASRLDGDLRVLFVFGNDLRKLH